MTLTVENQQKAIAALKAAIENGTPLATTKVFGPNGAMCSCAVVAQGLGLNLKKQPDDGKVYDFLEDRGFDTLSIFNANDDRHNRFGQGYDEYGGFAAAMKVIEEMKTS